MNTLYQITSWIKPIRLTWQALSPGRPQKIYKGSPVSVMNALYKTILQVSLLYWLNKLCLQGDLNNEYEESSPLSLRTSLFKTVFRWMYPIDSLKLWLQCAGFLVHSFNYVLNHVSTHITTQKWPTYYKYEQLCQMGIQTQQNFPISTRIQPTATATTQCIAKNIYQKQIFPSNATYASYLVWMKQLYQYIYTSYEHTAINNMMKSTGIHIFHIIGICLWTNNTCHNTYIYAVALIL